MFSMMLIGQSVSSELTCFSDPVPVTDIITHPAVVDLGEMITEAADEAEIALMKGYDHAPGKESHFQASINEACLNQD